MKITTPVHGIIRMLTTPLTLASVFLANGNVLAAESRPPITQLENLWYQAGQKLLKQKQQQQRIDKKAKNIILFVADGNGITSNTAIRIYAGQAEGKPGEEHVLSYETFPHLALSKTYNTNAQTPDSAGTASAMMTGIKTKQGVISINETVDRGDCVNAQKNTALTILELAELTGMSTGVVTSTRITHATPAATYAHSADRNYENDTDLSAAQRKAGCKDIAAQLVDHTVGDGLEVALGGGAKNFLPKGTKRGKRQDGRDLTKEWLKKYPASHYITDRDALMKTDTKSVEHLLGLFSHSHMSYETDRVNGAKSQPSLAEMTIKAIEVLQKNPEGFFLLVEGGRIDHAHHAGNAQRALEDGRAYAAAVAAAMKMTSEQDTLIIATADHSHTIAMQGYAKRGNPILGLLVGVDAKGHPKHEPHLANDGKPYTTLTYANGPGATEGKRADLSKTDVTHKDFTQPALVPLESETHGGEDVAIYARGPRAYLVDGTVEQHYIFHVMEAAGEFTQRIKP